jgi:hypothetical protein
MKNGKPVVCPFTQGHFGWGDHELDSVFDPFDSEIREFKRGSNPGLKMS